MRVTGSSTGTIIQRNTIGTDDANVAVWSGHNAGIELGSGAANTLIGGVVAGEANTIANAGTNAANPNSITIQSTAGTGNSILGNSLVGSRGIGIDLGPLGVTPNDAGDGDGGPNDRLNFPFITSAISDGSSTVVTFDLDVPANPDQYRVEFFTNPSGTNPAGNWEGERLTGVATVSPGAGHSFSIAAGPGDVITATATAIDSGATTGYSSTSELSAAAAVSSPTVVVNSTGDNDDATPGDDRCDTGAMVGAAAECTLRAALTEANAPGIVDTIEFDIPASLVGGAHTIDVGATGLPSIVTPLTIDGSTEPDFGGTPVIELNGSATGAGVDGLVVAADDVEIRGLAINRFGADGIEVDASAGTIVIAGNHLGVDHSGLVARPNGERGVDLQSGSGPTTVGGTNPADRNIVSGNTTDGITVFGTNNNIVIGNLIGTDITGTSPIPNGSDGVWVANGSSGTRIGQVGAGNVISGNTNDGIEVDDVTPGTIIEANTIGLGLDGATIVANGRHGIVLYNGANNTLIGGPGAGNVISGNAAQGVHVNANTNLSTSGNRIEGNLIGTDASGMIDRGNGTNGIELLGNTQSTTIGGSAVGAGNVISASGSSGVLVSWADTATIAGNTIGLAIDEDTDLGNGSEGIRIEFGSNVTIGGPGAGNTISWNGSSGIMTSGTDVAIEGNRIGTDGTGLLDRGNLGNGILAGGDRLVIGGTAMGAGNVIGGNTVDGIQFSSGILDARVEGNLIGVGSDGTTAVGNGFRGISLFASSNVVIGGTAAGAGNEIANHPSHAVLTHAAADQITLLGNSIHDNGGLGFDLNIDGVTPNDPLDADGGPNGQLNYPEISSATESGGIITLSGSYDVPAGSYRFEFFTNPSGGDASGYGEGETLVASSTLSHSGGGPEPFGAAFPGTGGDVITATITEEFAGPVYGSTSEFSAAISAVGEVRDAVSGSVWEDVDGDGDILDDGVGVPAVQVWVFADQGNGEPDAGDPIAGTAVTDGSGNWSVDVDADGIYWAAVDSTSIEPAAGYNVSFDRSDVWADQTYASADAVTWNGTTFGYTVADGPLVGGKQADVADGFPSLARSEHVHRAIVAGADVTGLESGFSFQVVSNTLDELDPGSFTDPTSWETYDAGANGVGVDPDGYRGVVDDGRYLYFAPYGDGVTYHGEVLRYDTTGAFSAPGSWSTFDPSANGVGTTPIGYAGAVFDGHHIYFSPYGSRHGEVLRYDTQATFDSAGSWAAFDPGANGVGTDPDGYLGAVWDGRYVYFSPFDNGGTKHGEVLRYDTQAAFTAAGSWAAFDPGANGVGTDPDGFVGAAFDGRYLYLAPFDNGTDFHGEVLRYDTQAAFNAAGSWTTFDPGANGVGSGADGFAGVVFDGRHLYFVPSQNAGGRHGEVLRYDTAGGFSAAGSWTAFDPGANGVGNDPDGFRGATFDGRHLYFVPFDNGSGNHGEVLRYDTVGDFTTVGSWTTFDAGNNGIGSDPDGFAGAVFAGRHVYFSPLHNGTEAHGEVLRHDTGRSGQGSIRQLIENSEAITGAQSSQFSIPTTDSGYTASPLSYTIHPVATLPTITDTLTLDASTQPGAASAPIVELDGSLAGALASGLVLTSNASTVRAFVINRFTSGIEVLGGAGNSIVGNHIGPDVTGNVGNVGNRSNGIYIYGSTGTIIGGSAVADRNVISGNRLRGVFIDDLSDGAPAVSSGTRVIGNYIGTDRDGVAALPYGAGAPQQMGVALWDGSGNDLGGPGAEGNVVSGNSWHGLYLWGPNATDNTIQGNIVGLDASASSPIGNGADDPNTRSGILLSNTSGNLVGGTVAGEGNLIAGNDAIGLAVSGSAADNAMIGNTIVGNAGIGIDLDGGTEDANGVTANDSLDGDTGPNGLLNHPVITSATESGGIITLSGSYDVPAGSYRFEFFTNPSGGDASGFGEGETLVASSTLSHSGSGAEPFGAAFPGTIGDVITATITEESPGPVYGSTSEFSALVTVTAAGAGGAALDSSGRRADTTAAGGLDINSPAAGLVGNGFDMGGGTERLVGPAVDVLADQLTVSGWVRLDTSGIDSRVVAKAASDGAAVYELLVDSFTAEAVARMQLGGSTVEVRGGAVGIGVWHQLAATWDGAIVRLYVDGTEVDSAPGTGPLATDVSIPLVIGNLAAADRGLDGRLDQVQVSHSTRSADWIATARSNQIDPSAFVSMGAAQTSIPGAWTVSTSLGRTGSNSLSAPETAPGADAWLTAIGVDEPGIEFSSWWRVSNPAAVDISSGTRTGAVPTNQHETSLTGAGFDLGTIIGRSRSQEAPAAGSIPADTWAQVVVRTDEMGVSSVFVDGVQMLGPTLHSGGELLGSAGLRAGNVPSGVTWNVDDAQLRRLVSDEPTTSLGALDRN